MRLELLAPCFLISTPSIFWGTSYLADDVALFVLRPRALDPPSVDGPTARAHDLLAQVVAVLLADAPPVDFVLFEDFLALVLRGRLVHVVAQFFLQFVRQWNAIIAHANQC